MSREVSVMKYSFAMSLSAALLALSFTPAVSAQEQLTNREQEEFLAESSKQLGMDEALIERSIAMSDYAGGLEEELLERFPELHSAVSIDVPNSTIQVHAKQISAKSSEFNAFLNDRKHPYRVVYVPAQTSEEERVEIISAVNAELRKAGIVADLEGNAYLDKVVVTVTKDDSKKVENLRSTLEKNVSRL